MHYLCDVLVYQAKKHPSFVHIAAHVEDITEGLSTIQETAIGQHPLLRTRYKTKAVNVFLFSADTMDAGPHLRIFFCRMRNAKKSCAS